MKITMTGLAIVSMLLLSQFSASANPYFDPTKVPQDKPRAKLKKEAGRLLERVEILQNANTILRVDIDWVKSTDTYELAQAKLENSGTEALFARSSSEDALGSYKARLVDPSSGEGISYDSLGTGKEFRRLSRGLTFRFPVPAVYPVRLELRAENPISGKMETVISELIDSPSVLESHRVAPEAALPTVRRIKEASMSPQIILNVYAEGYLASRKERFWQDAQRTSDTLGEANFPLWEHFQVNAVFQPSKEMLGKAQNRGDVIRRQDSYLSLYHPHWNNFGRWYHVVYPTDYKYFRDGLGSVPYDYTVILIDSNEYWGVGNYRELTAIPNQNGSFRYLLLHEIGHYFGLNEEYNGGGRTELEFAPGITEPWSQNITFRSDDASALKWSSYVSQTTPVPTSNNLWKSRTLGPYGAYSGGYADSTPVGKSHKPGLECIMDRSSEFCPICNHAIQTRIKFDLGI